MLQSYIFHKTEPVLQVVKNIEISSNQCFSLPHDFAINLTRGSTSLTLAELGS